MVERVVVAPFVTSGVVSWEYVVVAIDGDAASLFRVVAVVFHGIVVVVFTPFGVGPSTAERMSL